MAQTRREFLRCAAGLGGLLLAGSAAPAAPRHTAAVRAALGFFAGRQSPDGAWRSSRYAAFRDGDALTPVVLWAMQAVPSSMSDEVFARGLRWLERLTDTQSRRAEPWAELRYPLFTASYAAQVLAAVGDWSRAAGWADLLERLRTSPALGWPVADPGCGAWSDAPAPPRYSAPVPDMVAPNISATALAAQALAAAGRRASAFVARPFAESCQNFGNAPDDPFDDGGFFFASDDPIRNKAGSAGRDAAGRRRFLSYGSATCDGILALRACGVRSDHPRRRAAVEWLRRESAGAQHAGVWSPGRDAARESLVFYHAQALATVLADLAATEPWAAEQQQLLRGGIAARQAPDGSWQGAAPESCEDETLLATAFAVRALAS
jgi:hypothetical protein